MPQMNTAVSSLVLDFIGCGTLNRMLVAAMGEFGRTPKINASAGRDYWNYCYSLSLAGGGIKSGLVYDSSNKIGH